MTQRLRRVAAAGVLFLVAAFVVLPVTASGQDEGAGEELAPAPLLLRAVDATDPETQQLTLMYGGDDLESMQLTQRGQELAVGDAVALPDAGGEIGTVVVVDTGAIMADEGALVAVRERLAGLANAIAGHQSMAIVAAGDSAQALTTLTTSSSRLENAASQLGPSENGGAAVYTGIRSAVDLLRSAERTQPNIVVVTAGGNIIDESVREAALGDVSSVGAALFVAGFGGMDPAPWQSFVDEVGGAFTASGSPEDLADTLGTFQSWQASSQYIVPFVSEVTVSEGESELVPTTLTIGEAEVEFSYVTGQYQQGAAALNPPEEVSGGLLDLSFLQNDLGQMLGVILVLAAVAMGIYALAVIFTRDDSALSNVLEPYSEGFQATGEPADDEEEGSAIARMALVKRAVEATEEFAEKQGYLSRTEAALERADLPLRAGEALFIYVLMVALASLFGLLLLPPMGALVIVLVVALLPPAFVSFMAGQRRRKFEQLLPDMLQLLSGTLRAGYSLMQGVEAVSQEVADPMGKELRRVVTESRLGRPLEEALDGVAERMTSPDFAWAVMAIRIQREVGGNLSELLLTVADTMVQRERLRREVKALTAEGRMSAIILGLLPIGLGLAMFVINPDYMGKLFDTTLGNILLGLAIVSMGIGFAWMKQIISIEV